VRGSFWEIVVSRPIAYALVDRNTKLIRMEPDSTALAIFDTRRGAREAKKVHAGTMIVPITMKREKKARV
jgi:hypothetical protein